MHPAQISCRKIRWAELFFAGLFFVMAATCGAAGLTLGADSAHLWLGRSQVVAFQSDLTVPEKRVYETRIQPDSAAEILQVATILDGEKTGFLRLLPRKAGKATLMIGDLKVPVEISASKSDAFVGRDRPEIISPTAGAFVYGTISVGVNLPARDPRAEPPAVVLRMPGRADLVPKRTTVAGPGANRIHVFELKADEILPGPLKLVAAVAGKRGRDFESDPVYINVIRPDASQMISGACADRIDQPRPERYGEKPPLIAKDDSSAPSGYIKNYSADPTWFMRETVAEPGYYQLTLRARGDPSLGSFPSVGVNVDDKDKPVTAVRLADNEWHRVPVGHPVFLEAGEHVIAPRFLNDFAGKGSDRNLFIERYELVRVASGSAPQDGSDSMMMMSAAPAMNMMMQAAKSQAPGVGDGALRVAFSHPIHRLVVNGPVTVTAFTAWKGDGPAPRVDMLVNGRLYSSSCGDEADFKIPPSMLKSGANVFQLRASLPNGITVDSPAQSVQLPGPVRKPTAQPRYLACTAFDPGWDQSFQQRLEKQEGRERANIAAFYSNGESSLSLPSNLKGEFHVRMEARGQDFQGPPVAECFLRTDTGLHPVGQVKVAGSYRELDFGKVMLAAGTKQLVIRFSNDLAEQNKGDRNWWLKSISLEEAMPAVKSEPTVKVLYAPKEMEAPRTDAVVVRAFSENGFESADLVVDGKKQNINLKSEEGLGRLVFPLMAEKLPAGVHTFQVALLGKDGRETLSAVQSFDIKSAENPAPGKYARALHMLNRFGYGPEPEELADVLTLDEPTWLRSRLDRAWNDPGEQAAMGRAMIRYGDEANKGQVVPRVLMHLLLTDNPARARFVLWAENHFSTWIQKTEPLTKWKEHQQFLETGAAPFSDLLFASATSPAMLVYLDQARSFDGKLNENYAREIMELHTVGVHGGYSQADVTSLAGLLTGWTLSEDSPLKGEPTENVKEFRYEPAFNSAEDRRVFGMEFAKAEPAARFDRVHAALEMLAAHPATACFISRKLAEHYVSAPAPDALVDKLTKVFRKSGGDMTEVLMAIAASEEFLATIDTPRIATPLDYSLRLCRMVESRNAGAVEDFLRKSGTGLFDHPSPDGFPELDAAYADSNALIQRWRFANSIQGNLRRLVPTGVPLKDAGWEPENRQRVLNLAAARLLGGPLSQRSNDAAMSYLESAAATENDRTKLIATFLTQLPENSLR